MITEKNNGYAKAVNDLYHIMKELNIEGREQVLVKMLQKEMTFNGTLNLYDELPSTINGIQP